MVAKSLTPDTTTSDHGLVSQIGNWQSTIGNALSPPNSRQVVRVRFECGHCRLCVTHPITPPPALHLQHPAIVIRDDPHEFGQPLIPRNQNLSSTHATRDFDVAKDHLLDCFNLFFVVQGSEFYHFDIAPPRKVTISVEHICQSARHTRAKISSSFPEHDDASAGPVFAAVIANSFNHDKGAAVTHAKPFAGNSADVALATGGAIEGNVTNDHIF